jgi:hypothetical protein
LPIVDKHAPVKKLTVRPFRAPWIIDELKNDMVQRNYAKRLQTSQATQLIGGHTVDLEMF